MRFPTPVKEPVGQEQPGRGAEHPLAPQGTKQRCRHLLFGAGPRRRGAATGKRDELCRVNHSFPIPPFWQSRRHLPLPTKGIGSARLGKGHHPSLPSSAFSCCPRSARPAEHSHPRPRAMPAQPLPRISSVHGHNRSPANAGAAQAGGQNPHLGCYSHVSHRAAHGSLSSSVARIKTIKINRIMHLNLPLFPLNTEEEPNHC